MDKFMKQLIKNGFVRVKDNGIIMFVKRNGFEVPVGNKDNILKAIDNIKKNFSPYIEERIKIDKKEYFF